MRIFRLLVVAMGVCLLICKCALSQNDGAGFEQVLNFPSSFFNKFNRPSEKPEHDRQLTNKIKSITERRERDFNK